MSETPNPETIYISPSELVVHPKLIEIYGENENRPALEKSISEKGILESLKVSARTGVNIVLAGKCRLQIARQLGFPVVKVEFVKSSSPEEDLKLVLDFNLHREGGKTHFQKFHEGQYWENVLRPQAKERQRERGRCLNQSKYSNLNTLIDANKSQLKKGKSVIQEVSENLNISVGSYHKGKKVFDFISQLRKQEKFKAAVALEGELNRSIDAAYKFVCDEDTCNQVINLIEADSCCSVADGIAWVLCGERNSFRGFDVGQVVLLATPPVSLKASVICYLEAAVPFSYCSSKRPMLLGDIPETIPLRTASEAMSSFLACRERQLLSFHLLISIILATSASLHFLGLPVPVPRIFSTLSSASSQVSAFMVLELHFFFHPTIEPRLTSNSLLIAVVVSPASTFNKTLALVLICPFPVAAMCISASLSISVITSATLGRGIILPTPFFFKFLPKN
ncbi:hypothetical protein [Scytonema sp. UIC 10036]|uniref:hypothetical protein n=1 Tax=Scytonema sp. UIC 10036 TaxID=2304196 RepID=UPI001FAA993D|nr:hypothetical protein [Scytonema sp. UIC 10036]